jgi:hypothetical protein
MVRNNKKLSDNPNPNNNVLKSSKSNDTIHGLTKDGSTITLPVKIHDYFNIISILTIVLIDLNYLRLRSPSFNDMINHKIGTPIYDERLDFDDATHLPFTLLYNIFTTYLLIDTLWIIVQPGIYLIS